MEQEQVEGMEWEFYRELRQIREREGWLVMVSSFLFLVSGPAGAAQSGHGTNGANGSNE